MRYHKAIEISRPEADFIIRTSSGNAVVVVSHSGTWYDVRALTGGEIDEFAADLLRGHGEFAGRLRHAALSPIDVLHSPDSRTGRLIRSARSC